MRNASELAAARREASDCPTAWFAVLERARDTHDCELAGRALGSVRRQGELYADSPQLFWEGSAECPLNRTHRSPRRTSNRCPRCQSWPRNTALQFL